MLMARRAGGTIASGASRRLALSLALFAGVGCDPIPSSRSGGSEDSGGGRGPWPLTERGEKAGLLWKHGPFNPGGAFDAYDRGNGVAAGAFNGDGHGDVLLLPQCGPTGYFLGRGDGTFEDRSDLLAVLNDGIRVAVAYGDFDEDGRTDFYVTFTRRPNALLHQNADGTFTDVAAARGVALVGHYSGASFVDVDGDGDLDLVVAGNIRFTDPVALKAPSPGCPTGYVGLPVLDLFTVAGSDPSALFINGGAGSGWTFTEEAGARGLPLGGDDPAVARGFGDLTVLDYNRDGKPDLLFPEMFRGKAALLENDGTGRFTDVTAARMPQPSYGSSNVAAEDFDEDGDLDIVAYQWHASAVLWRNDLPRGRHWLDVDLHGSAPRDPIGARVELTAGGKTQVRWMQGSRGYLSQSTRLVHFGLGEEARIDSVTVRWPDGTSTVVDHPRADRRLVVAR